MRVSHMAFLVQQTVCRIGNRLRCAQCAKCEKKIKTEWQPNRHEVHRNNKQPVVYKRECVLLAFSVGKRSPKVHLVHCCYRENPRQFQKVVSLSPKVHLVHCCHRKISDNYRRSYPSRVITALGLCTQINSILPLGSGMLYNDVLLPTTLLNPIVTSVSLINSADPQTYISKRGASP